MTSGTGTRVLPFFEELHDGDFSSNFFLAMHDIASSWEAQCPSRAITKNYLETPIERPITNLHTLAFIAIAVFGCQLLDSVRVIIA